MRKSGPLLCGRINHPHSMLNPHFHTIHTPQTPTAPAHLSPLPSLTPLPHTPISTPPSPLIPHTPISLKNLTVCLSASTNASTSACVL